MKLPDVNLQTKRYLACNKERPDKVPKQRSDRQPQYLRHFQKHVTTQGNNEQSKIACMSISGTVATSYLIFVNAISANLRLTDINFCEKSTMCISR